MKVVFLGTSAVFPTRERNHSCVALDIGPELFLFDCGEGTQRQIAIAGLSPGKITKIFLTHWHGDHILGLPGLLQSFAMNNRTAELDIFGPEHTRERLHYLLKGFEVRLPFKINVHETAKAGKILRAEDYEVSAEKLEHPIACLGYAFKEKDRLKINVDYLEKFGLKENPIIKNLQEGKDIEWQGKKIKAKDATFLKEGKKFVYVVDTEYFDGLVKFAEGADCLVCESTFAQELLEAAQEQGHMTAKQAGKLAHKAKAKQLAITHFSQRYRNIKPLLDEAKKEFTNTIAARDFLEIKF